MKKTKSIIFSVLLVLFFSACGEQEPRRTEKPSVVTWKAGVLISPSDDNVQTYLVTGEGDPESTAFEVLEETQVDLITTQSPFGTGICSIVGVGQPADNCFGDPEGEYWAFFIRENDGSWRMADVGVDLYTVVDGDIIAFMWTGSDADFFPLRTPPSVDLNNFE